MTTKLALISFTLGLAAISSQSQTAPFTKVTTGPIASQLGGCPSATWGDFQGTGFLDLFVCRLGLDGHNGYFRNNGDATFTENTGGDGVNDTAAHIGPAVADYDNDGHFDLLISQNGWQVPASSPPAPQVLYHNNGDGSFTLAASSGVTNVTGFYWWSSAVDYDNDGFLDFFLSGASGRNGGVLFHNNSDGTFGRPASALNSLTDSQNVSWADYDGDGFMDCLISGSTRNFLYHNNGNGSFTRVTTNAVAQDAWSLNPYGSTWGDFDNCGQLDLFVTGVESTNRLYHNLGNGLFTNITSGPMLRPPPGGAWNSCAWGDYDNDGYLDLFVSGYGATNALFHNNGDGTFTQVLSGPPVEKGNTGDFCNSCGWADYDNDGFLDLLVTRGSSSGPVANWLYHNNGNSNAWLEVKLIGTAANRSGIGAKVRVHAAVGGKSFWQLREIESSGGRTIQALVAHFGLGDATNVDTLRIEWPSGTVQELHEVAPRQILTVTEPPRLRASVTNGVPQFALKAWPGMQFEVQSSADLATWSPIGNVTVTNLAGLVSITDTNALSISRFYRARQQ